MRFRENDNCWKEQEISTGPLRLLPSRVVSKMADAAFSASLLSSFSLVDEGKRGEPIWHDSVRAPVVSHRSLLAASEISPGLHNTLCVLAGILLLLWLIHLLRRLVKADKVRRQFAVQQHPLHLRGLAGYSEDLQRLFRIHFEKLVRNYNPASPLAILRVRVAAQTKSVLFLPCTSSPSGSSVPLSSSASSHASPSFSFLPSHGEDRQTDSRFRLATSGGDARGTSEEQKGTAVALAVGPGGRGDVELVVDACDAATVIVYWGVDARALQKALTKKADEVSICLGSLDGPLHLPRSLRRIFGVRRLASSRPTRRSAVHPDASRSLLELEGRDGQASSGPDREREGERLSLSEQGGSTGAPLSSPPLLTASEYRLRSAEVRIEAGMNQRVRISPLDPKATLGSFAPVETADAPSVEDRAELPLIVVASLLSHSHQRMSEVGHLGAVSVSEASTHVLILRRSPQNSSSLGLELAKEVVLGGGLMRAQERLDVYGLEEGDTIGGETECLVCMTNAKDVMLYPCRHCSLCFDCLRSLHQERCPICRSNFSAFVTFPFKRAHALLPSSTPSLSSPSSSSARPSVPAPPTSGERGRTERDRDMSGSRRSPRSPSASPERRRGDAQRGVERPRDGSEEEEDDRGNATASSGSRFRRGRDRRRGRAHERSEGVESTESSRGVPGMLLDQLRHYVHYDELGSDVLSDSDS
ncbi:putative zinc finger protein [Toxoplasma gondii GAB2-2007-GAL-DOM2]|uniref:Zinc finger protein n=3 Tax=Toxoplasma gondii TaxID=5811 RepID=V4Z7N5_TOXGV|nr:putative zinc finger protein [Toxoplasma gondii VEG]KFG30454.1 putative zinc finger protein [Toxoplasma gondii GAB2-2007-GAL-DOM2]